MWWCEATKNYENNIDSTIFIQLTNFLEAHITGMKFVSFF